MRVWWNEDTYALGAYIARCAGSSPVTRTNKSGKEFQSLAPDTE